MFVLWQIAEKAIKYAKAAYLYFIALTKAFDKIRITDVEHTLEEEALEINLPTLIIDPKIHN